jgi:hypothetical protein
VSFPYIVSDSMYEDDLFILPKGSFTYIVSDTMYGNDRFRFLADKFQTFLKFFSSANKVWESGSGAHNRKYTNISKWEWRKVAPSFFRRGLFHTSRPTQCMETIPSFFRRGHFHTSRPTQCMETPSSVFWRIKFQLF